MLSGIRRGETIDGRKTVYFAIYDNDGLITDAEAFADSRTWAVNTFSPGASDLKVGYDSVASANYSGTFSYRKNGEWSYVFTTSEVSQGSSVYAEFFKTGYRSFVIRLDLIEAEFYDQNSVMDKFVYNVTTGFMESCRKRIFSTAAAAAAATTDAADNADGEIGRFLASAVDNGDVRPERLEWKRDL